MDKGQSDTINIKVKRGLKIKIEEVDSLDNDRQFVAEAPKDLKLSITRIDPTEVLRNASTISMCG